MRLAILGLLVLSMSSCVGRSARMSSQPAPPASPAASQPVTPAPGAVDVEGAGLMLFLLIGQSNMVGAPRPEPEDEAESPGVLVLAYEDCPRLGRVYNQWYPARAPLHGCNGGVGPGDHLGRALARAMPNARIGLVPLAINGVDIDFFSKGVVSARRREFRIPPDDHWEGAYEWVLERARLAQRAGTIRGIAFHQGESDTGNQAWIGKVKTMVTDLRTDLGLGKAPFVAGELLYTGCCGKWHNPLVAQLPGQIENSLVVSAEGLTGMDSAHFDSKSQRELGERYAEKMMSLLQAVAP